MAPMLLLSLAWIASLGLARATAQEPAPQPSPGTAGERADEPADGGPADERARMLWDALCKASRAAAEDGARAPITAFDLSFDGRAWSPQSNDFEVRQRYLAPDWVRTTLKSGRERIRGPSGDWLVDPKTGEKLRLQGRGDEQDRRELGEAQQVARSFVAFADPCAMKLSKLEALAAPPGTIPAPLAQRAAGLDWIAIQTASLHRARTTPESQANFRAQLGLDRTTRLPQMAIVWEETNGERVAGSAQLIDLLRYTALDGYRVPDRIKVYPPDPDRAPAFAEAPSLQLDLRRGGSLRPALTERDFLP